MAQAGQALFSTGDVVNIGAKRPRSDAGRLGLDQEGTDQLPAFARKPQEWPDWYMNVMGAVQDAKIASRCCAQME